MMGFVIGEKGKMMTNAEKFKQLFGLYATELWSKSEEDFLMWLNMEYVPDTNVGELISRQAAIDAAIDAADDWDGGYDKERERFIREALEGLPSAQTKITECPMCPDCPDNCPLDIQREEEKAQLFKEDSTKGKTSDAIYRQAAIDVEGIDEQIRCEMCRNPMHTDRGCDGNCKYDEKLYERIMQILGERIKPLPSAQPERLTDDDFETIRIHLNAFKEKLCNQRRWKEAEEYQRIIDRFISFSSAQPRRGKWRKCISQFGWQCSECNQIDKYAYSYTLGEGDYNTLQDYFCPNCGADMREGEQDG